MKRHIKNNVYWVGKIDWELRKFHGDELSTQRGSTYNSYLIEEKQYYRYGMGLSQKSLLKT